MANTTSAKKATRKIARRTIINKSRRTQMRGAVRTVEEAIQRGDRDAALKAMVRAEPELMQAAQRNIIHKTMPAEGLAARRIKSPSSRNKIDRKICPRPARCRLFSLRRMPPYCSADFVCGILASHFLAIEYCLM
jgi:small subunit ribosomal protein S20